jgi:hypothetical protein
MFQLRGSDPELMQAFDSVKMMLDLYRKAGVRGASDWLRAPEIKVMPTEQAMNTVADAGENAVPLGGGTGIGRTGQYAAESV